MELTIDQALQQGVEAHKKGRLQDAEKLYRAVLQAQPAHPDANHNLGVLAVSVGKAEVALPLFKAALEANQNTVQFWLSYIDVLIKLDRLPEAKAALDQARVKEVQGEGFDRLEQRLNARNEMPTEADIHQPIDKSSSVQNPTQGQLQHLIGLLNQGQLHQVLNQIKRLLQQFPNSPILYDMYGVASQGIGRYDDAIASFHKALKIHPGFAESYNGLGNVQIEKGDLKAAINSFKQAVAIKPNFADAHNNMGSALNAQGDLQASIDCYERALKIKPDFAEAYFNMGNALQEQGNVEAAIGRFKKALKIKPDFPEAYNNLGGALRLTGDLEGALRCYDKLSNQEAIGQALECVYILGKHDKFNERLKTIIKKDPSNIRVAAISAFAAQQIKKKDPYPFCENPLELVKFNNIKNHIPNPDWFIEAILDEIKNEKATWAPKSHTTKGGFRTSGNLFFGSCLSPNIKILEDIIRKELGSFYSKYYASKDILIRNWPEEYNLQGWYVRLLQGGYQNSHIHPTGWVSGVFYLKTVKAPVKEEGAIEFGLHGYDYPVKNQDNPRLLYQPSDGDFVLFPSSLFHRTIPVIKDVERCVIAFDLVR